MPQGSSGAPGWFVKVINEAIKSLVIVAAYLDDVIVYSDTLEQHFDHLDSVMSLLHKAGLTLKLPKCHFFKNSVDYLGHIVTPGRLEISRRATDAIDKALPPRNATGMRSFLGLCNVYRRFVPNFSRITKPLNQRLTKGQPTKWGDLTNEETEAFKTLKTRLINPPVLALPKVGRSYIVDTDACAYQVGCVLLQEQDGDERPKPIGYWSRSLSKAERNYTTTEQECLSIVWAVVILRPYLEGTEFTIRTDHDSLKWLLNLSDATGRLQRWRLRLQQFE